MTDWVVRPKTEAPTTPAFAVSRPRLCQRLSHGLTKPVTVVAGPLGFGKTVLLSQWSRERADRKLPTGWLRLDQDDNSTGVLAAYIAVVLRRLGFDHPGLDELSMQGAGLQFADRVLVSSLNSDQCHRPSGAVLVLDGVERLTDSRCQSSLQPLLEYLPADLHVVLSTRQPNRLPITDLRLAELVATLGPHGLQLRSEELASGVDDKLTPSQLAHLRKLSGGWPASVAMFRAHLASSDSIGTAVDTFRGDSRVVSDYLTAEFPPAVSPELFAVLRDASLLDSLDPVAIEYVTARQSTRQDLASLNDIDGLLSLSDSSNLPALNPLLREYLCADLERTDAVRYRLLCRRTARWIADTGSVIDAMRCAVRIADAELAAEILEDAGGLMLWDRDGIAPLRIALSLLPDAIIRQRPRIALIQATVCLKDGQVTEARRILNAVRETVSEDEQLRYEIAKVALSISFYQGTAHDLHLDELERPPHIEGAIDPQAFYFTGKCLASLQSGDFRSARLAAQRGLSFDLAFSAAYLHLHLGVISLQEGRLQDAIIEYQHAKRIARRQFANDKDMRLVIDVLTAETSYERNELDAASRALGKASKRLRHGEAWFEIYAAGYTTALNLAYNNGGIGAVQSESQAALAYIHEQELRRLRRLVIANTSALFTRAGDHVAARQLVQENGLSLDEYIGERASKDVVVGERMAVGTALCRLLIIEKRYKRAGEAIEQLLSIERRIGHHRAVAKLSLLAAIVRFYTRRRRSAFGLFSDVLRQSRSEGFMRSVLDEAPLVDELLHTYSRSSTMPEQDHAQFLVKTLRQDGDDTTQLSRREREVLKLLGDALPDKLIARQLCISENTVRFHLKNVFRKFGVSSRLQAVAVARSRRLIDDQPVGRTS
ncbi:MAG: LuxR C-terminal-related transcriptional regulator [Pseudomonadota bacterium]